MQIAKLSPLGYETTTEKGNKYRKSNGMTYAMGVGTLALTITPSLMKNPEKSSCLSELSLAKTLQEKIIKCSELKFSKVENNIILGVCTTIDVLFNIGLGRFIDEKINTSRAEKADQKAETFDKNA